MVVRVLGRQDLVGLHLGGAQYPSRGKPRDESCLAHAHGWRRWHSGDPCRIPCRDYQPDPGMGTRLDVEDIKWTGACVGVPVQ